MNRLKLTGQYQSKSTIMLVQVNPCKYTSYANKKDKVRGVKLELMKSNSSFAKKSATKKFKDSCFSNKIASIISSSSSIPNFIGRIFMYVYFKLEVEEL